MRLPVRLAALSLVAVLVLGCGSGTEGANQPGPGDPCGSSDPAAAGYYPELEAKIPTTWENRTASSTKSGRYCSASSLGTLQSRGIDELRYAGRTWLSSDGEASLAMVTYEAPGLTATRLADEFERAARAAQTTTAGNRSDVTVDGRPGIRLDAVTTSSRETRIVWPSADGQRVNAIIASGVTEAAISAAEAAFST